MEEHGPPGQRVFETPQLAIHRSTPADTEMYFRLWNHPVVMANVGFPDGLGISREQIRVQLARQPDADLEIRLVVIRKSDGTLLGECKLGRPDTNGVSETDVKLFPEFWGLGYGTQVKRGLVAYLFSRCPECRAIKADPRESNVASCRMQEAVGAVRIERGGRYPVADLERYRPPEGHALYMVFRPGAKQQEAPGR